MSEEKQKNIWNERKLTSPNCKTNYKNKKDLSSALRHCHASTRTALLRPFSWPPLRAEESVAHLLYSHLIKLSLDTGITFLGFGDKLVLVFMMVRRPNLKCLR